MFKKRFEAKRQISTGRFPQCFAKQLHNPINVVAAARRGLRSVRVERACTLLGPRGSQNYSFAWSLERSISRQPVKDEQGQANICPAPHQPITVIHNHTHISSTATKAAEEDDKMGRIRIFSIWREKRALLHKLISDFSH